VLRTGCVDENTEACCESVALQLLLALW